MKKITQLIIASHNQGKISEIRNILYPLNIEVLSADDLNLPDIEETGTTFEENAKLKAQSLCQLSKIPCLADDSGLCVNALNGRPGIYSARYAPNRDFNQGMDLLLQEIAQSQSPDRSAYFACVIALAIPDEECKIFEGRVNGQIAQEKDGTKGFGYDPIFIPDGHSKTFANFSPTEKAAISHRGKALQQLISYLSKE